MLATKVIIWGASGHALVVADTLRLTPGVDVVGFIDDRPEKRGALFGGKSILGGRVDLAKFRGEGASHIVIAVGDCRARLVLAAIAAAHGFEFQNAVHPAAHISGWARLGVGIVANAGSIINAGCEVGDHVIANTGCSLDHECVIEEGVHVGPGAHLGGCVNVERGAWIGIGASIVDRVSIGAFSTVGAGSVVTRSIPSGVVAYGVPARIIREIAKNE